MIKKAVLAAVFAILGVSPLFPEQFTSTKFKGLNSNDNSVMLDPSEAQDLLNVDVTNGGKSIKKRKGFGLHKALGTGQPIRGGYHAFNSNGDNYQLWGSSTNLYGITSGETPVLLVSSATLGATWDCADTQGYSYCVNSSRDGFFKTDGSTMTWYGSPLGTMVESTPDRMIVAGNSSYPNTLYISESNNFTNHTTGVNETDAFTEVIAAPGSRLTHIRWGCGRILWWKDASFGYFDFDDQYTAQVKIISDTIGTFDNTSAIDPSGQVWFRGQDAHTWKYDCSSLSKESTDITPTIQASGRRVSNSWSQTSQSDFQSGTISPSSSLSTTISQNDLTVSSFAAVEYSGTGSAGQWDSGTASSVTIYTSSITLTKNNSGNIVNPDFETNWVGNTNGWSNDGSQAGNVSWVQSYAESVTCGVIDRQHASNMAFAGSSTGLSLWRFEAVDSDGNIFAYTSLLGGDDCSWTKSTLTIPSIYVGRRGSFRIRTIKATSGLQNIFNNTGSYILGTSASIYHNNGNAGDGSLYVFIDNIENGSSTITSGFFTSQLFDTGLTSATYQLQADFSVNTSTPSFSLETSTSSSGVFSTILTSTGTNAVGYRYARYCSTISITASDNARTAISSVTVIARSTGIYYSTVENAPNLTAWSIFSADRQLNGGGQTFYIRSSTNSFDVLSATPAWTEQSIGGLVVVATGTYFQIRDDFTITTATHTPTLNNFTVNWYEGEASDQAYMFYFDDAIWESVAYGAGQSANNYIFKRDLVSDGWTLYTIGTGGMLNQDQTLYFGDSSLGNIFSYGGETSDNGTAINSYWRSKTFSGGDPFVQNQFNAIDLFAKKDSGTTLAVTYTTDTSTATSYSMSLSTSNSMVQSRKMLPNGKLGHTLDLRIGDNSISSDWEFFGYRVNYTPLPYRPTQ